jgi:hypothetical protein
VYFDGLATTDDVNNPRDADESFFVDVVLAMAPLASRTGPWLAPVQIRDT